MLGKQPWPSGNAPGSYQHGPGFEAHRRPLAMSGRASGLNARTRTKVLSEVPPKPQGIGETEVEWRSLEEIRYLCSNRCSFAYLRNLNGSYMQLLSDAISMELR